MPLTLTIRNAAQLDNGSPVALVLDRRGAVIGRAATADWCLPDPSLHISSRHCEVRFGEGRYELIDHSTNGTFLHGQGARFAGPHTINQGDVFVVGPFEIAAALDDAAAANAAQRNAAPPPPDWRGWSAAGGEATPAPAASASAWDAVPTGSAISGSGPMSQSWAAPASATPTPQGGSGGSFAAPPSPAQSSGGGGWGAPAAPPPSVEPVASAWNSAPPPPAVAASEWSTPVAAPPPPGGDDIWGKFAASNVVDWARGGFGAPPPPRIVAAPAPIAATAPPLLPAATTAYGSAPDVGATAAAASAAAVSPTPPAAVAAGSGAGAAQFLAAAGLEPDKIKQGEGELLAAAGDVLRRVVSGLVVMLEARARGKSQMGAQGTNLEFDGNNPLKFARTPEQALAQLLNPAERGFMSSDRAIEDAFKDLQAHQMATLKAMQGALRATLDRFSPTAIRARADGKGLLGKILPAARDAALWKAYEREFGGVAQGSDEAFMDMFAKEFRRAYEEIAQKR